MVGPFPLRPRRASLKMVSPGVVCRSREATSLCPVPMLKAGALHCWGMSPNRTLAPVVRARRNRLASDTEAAAATKLPTAAATSPSRHSTHGTPRRAAADEEGDNREQCCWAAR